MSIRVKKLIIVIISLLLFATLVAMAYLLATSSIGLDGIGYNFSKTDVYNDSEHVSLYKTTGSDFKILQFTDLHYGDNKYGEVGQFDQLTDNLISTTIKQTNPDLVVFTGDLARTKINNAMYAHIAQLMTGIGVKWTFTFGNHDREGIGTVGELIKIMQTDKNCLFSVGPKNIHGNGNHLINIKTEQGANLMSLVFMDSNTYRTYDGDDERWYDYIYPDQIDWYEWLINGVANASGCVVPSLAFFHIPLPEHEIAYNLVEDNPQILLLGEKRKRVCAPRFNTGLFEKMVSLGSTKAVFVGHDHTNDYDVLYQGIRLDFGLSSGYSAYGSYDIEKGATLISVHDDATFSIAHLAFNTNGSFTP